VARVYWERSLRFSAGRWIGGAIHDIVGLGPLRSGAPTLPRAGECRACRALLFPLRLWEERLEAADCDFREARPPGSDG
jgi:hypothetical protein